MSDRGRDAVSIWDAAFTFKQIKPPARDYGRDASNAFERYERWRRFKTRHDVALARAIKEATHSRG